MQLLWISGIDGFCHRYEVLHRVAQAELLGARSVVRHFTDARLVRDAARADLVLAYRTPETPLVCTVLARARARGVPVLGTIDDLIFLPDDASQPAQAGWSAEARATWRDGVRRYRAVLDACDGFIAPTEPLLDAARALGWRSWLHRDALSAAELALGEDARRRAPEARDRRDLVLGYFSGTPTHDRDFSSIAGALADVLRRRPGCTLLVVGPLVLDAALQPLAGRIQRRPLVPWTELPGVLAGVDVCLAPLELDRPFAAAKGEVKYLEAAAVGVPTIATPTPAYRAAIAHGRTGMLADGPDAWRRALEELIEDPERRRALGAAARDDVAARFSPEVRARELRDILVAALAEPVRVARVPGAAPRPRAARGANVADEALVPDVGQGRVALESDARPVITLASHDAVSPPLASGVGLVQSLPRAPRDLRRLDLWTVTYGQRLEGVVTLRVIADDGRVLVRRRRRARTAPDRAWWSFAIPARCCRAARAARLELTWAGTPGAAALSFGLAAQPVRNPLQAAPAARLGGTPLDAALALRAYAAWADSGIMRGALDRARTLPSALRAVAAADGARQRVVFVERGGRARRFSLAALLERTRHVAAALAVRGVVPRSAVVIALPTGPDLVASYLAALLLGAVPALASTPTQRVRDADVYRDLLAGIVRDARARAVVCDLPTAALLVPGGGESFDGATLVTQLTTAPRRRGVRDTRVASLDPDEVATIQYSSGSTGRPKGVRLTHRAMLNNVRAVRAALALGPDDVSVNWIPLYHDMGLIDALLVPLLCGCETVLLPTGDFVREPRLWLEAITHHRGTISWAPNFAYALCVQRIPEHEIAGLDLSSWRLALNAAEPIVPETIAAFCERFAAAGFRDGAMTPAWGLAENVTIATVHPPGEPPRIERIDRAAAAAGRAVAVSDDARGFGCVAVGRPLPGCKLEIRDGVHPLGERAIGDVWLSSDSAFAGYDDAAAARPHDGTPVWLPTGDRGYVADGDLFFVARARDVIVIAGEKHAPHDVEAAINAVPGVRPGCAAAFGVRDEARGTEALAAVVETRVEDAAERARLARAIRSQVTRVTGLALRHLTLVPPGGVKKTTSGKLARAATRAAYAEEARA